MGKPFLQDAGPTLEHTDVPHPEEFSAAIQETTQVVPITAKEHMLVFSLTFHKIMG